MPYQPGAIDRHDRNYPSRFGKAPLNGDFSLPALSKDRLGADET
jgi:hypothetical protein